MFIKDNEGNVLTVKAVKRIKDHEGMIIVESANIYYNNKKIGTYGEDYMCGPAHLSYNEIYETEINAMGEAFLKKFPNGIKNENYSFFLKDLYKNNYLELLCIELCMLNYWEKEAKKAFKKGYEYFVVSKKTERHYEENWFIPTEELLKQHEKSNIIIFKAKNNDESAFNIDIS